jgi:acetyl esterase/lipase
MDKRPVIVFLHGGGLFKGHLNECRDEALMFARRKYVTASIDYRVGWQVYPYPTHCLGDNHTHKDALYRAVQDTKASLRLSLKTHRYMGKV